MITLKVSKEDNSEIPNVLWLQFQNDDGSGAMINLNDLATKKTSIIGKAMSKAIQDYLCKEKEVKHD